MPTVVIERKRALEGQSGLQPNGPELMIEWKLFVCVHNERLSFLCGTICIFLCPFCLVHNRHSVIGNWLIE